MTGKRTDKAANNDAPSGEASFLRLMKALLEFVMVRTGAHRGQGRDLQARIAATSDALDRLWAAPQLIDEFLAENPADFDERDLATIASWRTPVMGRFVVTGIQSKRFSCLPADAGTPPRLIIVKLIRREADELFRTIPCLIELVLLPFRGSIVTDGRIKRLSTATRPDGALVVENRLRLAALHKLVQTPSDLAELVQSAPEKCAGRASTTSEKGTDRGFVASEKTASRTHVESDACALKTTRTGSRRGSPTRAPAPLEHGSAASPRGSPTPQHARAMLNASFTSPHDNKEGASP